MKTIIIKLISLTIIVCVFGPAGCNSAQGSDEDGASEQEVHKTVMVETIGRMDIAEVLDYVADIQPFAEVRIFSPVPDRILSFPWQDGQEIKRGQRVALIRKEGIDKGLEQIVAQMESLDVQINNLKNELERSKGLLEAGVITKQTFDKIQTSYLSTLAQRKALEASRGQVSVTARNAVITAPIDGIIASKMLETGDMAVPQMPLCRIISIDKLKIKLKVVEADVSKIKLDQEVEISLDAYPEKFVGKVFAIMPYLDSATRTNSVDVVLDNPKNEAGEYKLKPGMFGRARIVVEERKGVLVAPEPALLLDKKILDQQKPGQILRKAFIVDEQSVGQKRLVELGARKGSMWEVIKGLAEGEKVVVRGQHGLKDDQKVRIVSE
jgi:RND family efflux transporter MFP subunit